MTPSSEDQRQAVNLGVSLSSQLIGAAFALMGIVGGFITYIIEDHVFLSWSTFLFLAGFVLYVCSIYQGSIGITIARNNGFNGNWRIDVTRKYFNRQSIYLGAGTFLFCLTILCANKPQDSNLAEQVKLNKNLERHVSLIDSLLVSQNLRNEEAIIIRNRLDSVVRAIKSSRMICKRRN